MVELRDYQVDIKNRAAEILKTHGLCYLAMEVRTGKTFTALSAMDSVGAKRVLFLTKKKAMPSIKADFEQLNPSYNMVIINYESIHKIENKFFDGIILDEAHSLGAYPKPSSRAKSVRVIVGLNRNVKAILMSGTPTPESYSQIFHQVYAFDGNPFKPHTVFYTFAKQYVEVKRKRIGMYEVNDYSEGRESIMMKMEPLMISYTQKEAGFKGEIIERFLTCEMEENTYNIINKLKKDKVVEGWSQTVLADTAVKLMSKVHQLSSGTVKFESGDSAVIDYSKAKFIMDTFKNTKIGIFYKFKEELNALKEIYGESLTEDIDEFDTTNKSIALQIVSGREGISLKHADYLVFYNIDFSATSYWQARDRMTTKDRKKNIVYWIFSDKGIERKIYKAVSEKKNYTLSHFKNDFL